MQNSIAIFAPFFIPQQILSYGNEAVCSHRDTSILRLKNYYKECRFSKFADSTSLIVCCTTLRKRFTFSAPFPLSIPSRLQSRGSRKAGGTPYIYIYNASVAVWESGWVGWQRPRKYQKIFWTWVGIKEKRKKCFIDVLPRGVGHPGPFPALCFWKIQKSRFWKWLFGSFWSPEIVSGWVLSCFRAVLMLSDGVVSVLWCLDFGLNKEFSWTRFRLGKIRLDWVRRMRGLRRQPCPAGWF